MLSMFPVAVLDQAQQGSARLRAETQFFIKTFDCIWILHDLHYICPAWAPHEAYDAK